MDINDWQIVFTLLIFGIVFVGLGWVGFGFLLYISALCLVIMDD